MKNTEKTVINEGRLVKFSENGGIVENIVVVKKKVKQKNYVLDEEVIKGIKELATQFKVNESRMLEEMYYTFAELLEKGKQEQKKTSKRSSKKDKVEVKAEEEEGK